MPELSQMAQDGGTGEKLIGIGKQLEGLARHASIHAAAVVITPRPVTEYMPLYKAPKGGEVVTQYNMHHVEDLGFLRVSICNPDIPVSAMRPCKTSCAGCRTVKRSPSSITVVAKCIPATTP